MITTQPTTVLTVHQVMHHFFLKATPYVEGNGVLANIVKAQYELAANVGPGYRKEICLAVSGATWKKMRNNEAFVQEYDVPTTEEYRNGICAFIYGVPIYTDAKVPEHEKTWSNLRDDVIYLVSVRVGARLDSRFSDN